MKMSQLLKYFDLITTRCIERTTISVIYQRYVVVGQLVDNKWYYYNKISLFRKVKLIGPQRLETETSQTTIKVVEYKWQKTKLNVLFAFQEYPNTNSTFLK